MGARGMQRKKPAPPEQTNAENFYYIKQMQARTPIVGWLTIMTKRLGFQPSTARAGRDSRRIEPPVRAMQGSSPALVMLSPTRHFEPRAAVDEGSPVTQRGLRTFKRLVLAGALAA